MTRRGLLGAALAVLLLGPGRASAELQLKPYVGFTFGGTVNLVPVAEASGSRTFVQGIGFVYLGEVFGVEADASYIPGYFERGFEGELPTFTRSSIGTVSGSFIVAMPRRIAQYSLRPYAVVGYGWLRARADDDFFPVRMNLGALNVGGGVTGFLTDRVGVGWDLRYFRSVTSGPQDRTLSFGDRAQLSFWRASMSVVVR